MFPNYQTDRQDQEASLAFLQRLIELLEQLQTGNSAIVQGYIYLLDLATQSIDYASNSLATILGYLEDEVESLGLLGLGTLIHPDDLAAVAAYHQRLISLDEGEVIELEYRMKRANGTWAWLRSRETLLGPSAQARASLICGLVEEISADQPGNVLVRHSETPPQVKLPTPKPETRILSALSH